MIIRSELLGVCHYKFDGVYLLAHNPQSIDQLLVSTAAVHLFPASVVVVVLSSPELGKGSLAQMQLRACSSLAVDETTTANFLGKPHQTALLRHAVIEPRIHSSRMQTEHLDLRQPHFDTTIVESHCKEDIE